MSAPEGGKSRNFDAHRRRSVGVTSGDHRGEKRKLTEEGNEGIRSQKSEKAEDFRPSF